MNEHILKQKAEQAARIAASFNTLQKSEESDLEKAEGDRGGKVIGRTKSGKPIYDTHNHFSHAKFSSQDHEDAEVLHGSEMKKYGKHSEKGRAALKHHQEQSNEHRDSSQALPGSKQLGKFDKEKSLVETMHDDWKKKHNIEKSEESSIELRKSELETNIARLGEVIKSRPEGEGKDEELIKSMQNNLGTMKRTLAHIKQYGTLPEGGTEV